MMQDIALSFFVGCTTLVSLVASGPIGTIARDVKSDLFTVDVDPMSLRSPRTGRTQNNVQFDVPSGGALDIFYRYGFFSLSVRVVPRDDSGSWLVREPTANIFERSSVQERTIPGSSSFDPQFQVYLCDDIPELLEAYFRDFKAEGVEQPHKLYTGSWRTATMAKYLGLSPDSLDGDSSFVLVKLLKRSANVIMDGQPRLVSDAQAAMNAIRVGDADSVLNFIQNYGSHYLKDLQIGDAVYQVFALTKPQYDNLRQAVPVRGQKHFTADQFRGIYQTHLAPWLIKETGKIQAASGDGQLQEFLDRDLQIPAQFDSYPNIFELQDNPEKFETLDRLTERSSAIIGLQMASLRFLVPEIQTREYYDEVVDTQVALWEVNI